MRHHERYLLADWPAPANIKAFVTTRREGFSSGNFNSFNMGMYSGDNQETVEKNRAQLPADWNLQHAPQWLKQVHGVDVIEALPKQSEQEADAMFTRKSGMMCTALTADCLPVLFCDRSGSVVASAHAGWKGLLAGVLENTVEAMDVPAGDILVWLGPAISQKNFEVGPEVREQFMIIDPRTAEAFVPGEGDRWFADIYQLARQRLEAISIKAIYGGGFCSVEQDKLFYSYRRDGKESGRMASVIWIEPDATS